MPVLVTGAETAVGRHAVRLLTSRGGEVRVFVARDDDSPDSAELVETYRAMGCKVAHGAPDDEGHLETALEQVHTVLHLAGRPTDDPDRHVDATATAVAAAIGAGVRRLVVLGDLAVTRPDGNPWLEGLAEVEELAAEAPLESVVLRCAVVHGRDDPLTAALAAGALGPDPAGAHWPVAAVDVATAAVVADAERDLDTSLHVVVGVAGPERLSTADLVSALARLRAEEGTAADVTLPPHAVELLTRQVDPTDDAVGRTGRRVADGW